jgi:hypothetical protein
MEKKVSLKREEIGTPIIYHKVKKLKLERSNKPLEKRNFAVMMYVDNKPQYIMACFMGKVTYTPASIYAQRFTKIDAMNKRDEFTKLSGNKHYTKFLLYT